MIPCLGCGQLEGIEEYDDALWDLYHRWDGGGRQYQEPLVFTGDWLAENIYDDDDVAAVKLAMEKNMDERGLCTECGRPDLRGLTDKDFLSEENAREIADMYAEMAAERRMGA